MKDKKAIDDKVLSHQENKFCNRKRTWTVVDKSEAIQSDNDVVLHHTLPVFMRLGWCLIDNWDFAGSVSIFGLDALPVIHQ